MTFDTKIAVVVREDLATWQKLNVTAFLVSGIAATVPEVVGPDYEDASGHRYLPMFQQPVLVFSADAAAIRRSYERARRQAVKFALFTEELFATSNDRDNRAAVKAVPSDGLKLVGLAMRAEKETIDRIFNGVSLHR